MALNINPFLDVTADIPRGELSIAGSPLKKLRLPKITTLIHIVADQPDQLSIGNISATLHQVIPPNNEVSTQDPGIGTDLGDELNLIGFEETTPLTTVGQTNPAALQSKSMVRQLPTNMREARNVLHLITAKRKGTSNESFGIAELKTIAKNLNIPAAGNKNVVADKLRTAIMKYFNISE